MKKMIPLHGSKMKHEQLLHVFRYIFSLLLFERGKNVRSKVYMAMCAMRMYNKCCVGIIQQNAYKRDSA